MSDDPRGFGVKLQTKEASVPSCNQPDCRTVEGSGDALRKQGNEMGIIGGPDQDKLDKPYADGSNMSDAGKPTTNRGEGRLETMPQGFTAGSGKPPSRLGD